MAKTLSIMRLRAEDAHHIVACFERVYGASYANELFYDAQALAERMASNTLRCVGAFGEDRLLGHMAMTANPGAASAELGNTVVDPAARGAGVAWQVGAELTAWCKSLGYSGFLHYPTTDHHIMQQHSVKAGFETGLMLGYIPAETDGKVGSHDHELRQAATVVYQPLAPAAEQTLFCPARYRELLTELAAPTGLLRRWQTLESEQADPDDDCASVLASARGLHRITISGAGPDFAQTLRGLIDTTPAPCTQLDFPMNYAGIEWAVRIARQAGFKFCGWLPGFLETDVLRLQKVDPKATDPAPRVVNPVAQKLLRLIGTD